MNFATNRSGTRIFLGLLSFVVSAWALWEHHRQSASSPALHADLGGPGPPTSENLAAASRTAHVERGSSSGVSVAEWTSHRIDTGSTASPAASKPVAGARAGSESHQPEHETPVARALASIEACLIRYGKVRDYTCTFSKRERIKGVRTPLNVLKMKVRTQPKSIYLKFRRPAAGREVIYVAGRNHGKVLAHDVGLNKLLAGTLRLDPTGARAMEGCLHPISEAGVGPLLDTLRTRWASELDPSESIVVFHKDRTCAARRCTMIETTHPLQRPGFMFYRVRLFIDNELGLPIRFEAYDWPTSPDAPAESVEV